MASTFSVVTTCKGRLDHLKLTLPHMMALPDCEVIVVDYDCPDGAGDWVRANCPAARLVQVKDRPLFSLSRARNIGAAAAEAAWLVFLDADVMVAPGLIEAIRAATQPDVYLQPHPVADALWGMLVVSREDFEALGGYDENFEGWGSEDVDFIWRLNHVGRTRRTFPGGLLASLPHDDAKRVRFHEIADRRVNGPINALYCAAKRDVARHGVNLSPEMMRNLYAAVRTAVQASGGPTPLNVALPAHELSGRTLQLTLTYKLSAQ